MTLKVIGVGYPRTGTASLKAALEQLGIGPCYHMSECIGKSGHWSQWQRAAEGEAVDWDEIFDGYAATTDAPGCQFYESLAAKYRDAKLVLTVRDHYQWFESTQATILSPTAVQRFAASPTGLNAMMHKLGWHPADASTHERDKMIARVTAHNEAVQRAITPTRLLVFEPRQGWKPLCEFLGLSVPDTPFPHINSTEDFQKMMLTMAGLDPGSVKQALEEQLSRQKM